MAVFLKHSVKRNWLEPMPKVIKVLAHLYDRYSEELMIVVGTEGIRPYQSLHPIGHAVSFRCGSRSKGDVMTALRNAGFAEVDFDLVDGVETGTYHLEFSPKSGLWKMKQDQLLKAFFGKNPLYVDLRDEWKKLRKEHFPNG